MTNRLDLAARCEAADGPDRELDAEIFQRTQRIYFGCGGTKKCDGCAFGCRPSCPTRVKATLNGGRRVFWWWTRSGNSGGTDDVPYTASIDAALTLVPEGWSKSIVVRPEGNAEAGVLEFRPGKDGRLWHGKSMADSGTVKAATPALALCAAALRAHSNHQDTEQ